MFSENTMQKNIVLVTGASGFLGQHVVKLLQEKDDNVDEIRCFDINKYENKLNHKTEKDLVIIEGDITKEDDVLKATKDVKWIINCASLNRTKDSEKLHLVNVEGVNSLLNAAFMNNVPYFIHISTADVCCGSNSNYYGSENTTSIPRQHILENYSKTKYQAELIVGKANGKILGNGYDRLRTIILRPTILYGEEDKYNVPIAFKWAKDFGGTLYKIDNTYTRLQWCYVGNAAWACIKAKEKILTDISLGGEEFFISDDTPIVDPYEFMIPFLESKNLKLSKRSIPYLLVQFFLFILFLLIKMIKPIKKIKIPSRYHPSTIQYFCTTHFFNRNKATLRLEYDPIFDADQSLNLSIEYYKNMKL